MMTERKQDGDGRGATFFGELAAITSTTFGELGDIISGNGQTKYHVTDDTSNVGLAFAGILNDIKTDRPNSADIARKFFSNNPVILGISAKHEFEMLGNDYIAEVGAAIPISELDNLLNLDAPAVRRKTHVYGKFNGPVLVPLTWTSIGDFNIEFSVDGTNPSAQTPETNLQFNFEAKLPPQ